MIRLKKYVCMGLHLLGFESINDFFGAVFALKYKVLSFYTYGFAIGGMVAFVRTISDSTAIYIYSPPAGIAILAIVSVFDFLLGISNSVINKKTDFNSWRISRSAVRFVVQTIFVAILFNMSLIWSIFIQSWIVDSLLLIFILSTFWSAFENAKDLGLVTKDQFETVEEFISIRKLIGKIRNKKDNETNQ